MFAAELTFRSWVATNGYRWVRYEDVGPVRGPARQIGVGWVLTENHDTKDPTIQRRYVACDPFHDHPALFREFAEIPWANREAAIRFASKYGMLDADANQYYCMAYPLPPGVHIRSRPFSVPCDPEQYWTAEPAMFRVLIRVWESRKANRLKELASLLRWEKCDPGYTWVCRPDAMRDDAPGMLPRVVYRNWVRPESGTEGTEAPLLGVPWTGMESSDEIADALLRQEISKGLDSCGYRLRLVPDPSGNKTLDRFEVAPQNLLGALYLQLGQTIAGCREQRQCKECMKWFELVPQDKGRKEFCSDACKAKEYRERKKRAGELKDEGKTPKEIAEATNTDLKTIKKWVSTKKRKGK
jgi:hypothetical protein